jgi:DnaJ-class molecular chaperone
MDEKIKISWKWFWNGWIFSKRWDLYVVPKVKLPKKLSKQEEEMWKELKKLSKSIIWLIY